MLSKAKIKLINSLQIKKIRDEEKLFVIEGDKLVVEFLSARVPIKMLLAQTAFINGLTPEFTRFTETVETVTFEELKMISSLKTPHNALAVVRMPSQTLDLASIFNTFCVALDFIQDPGNMGTIIRAAGWFGIKNIICSPDSADIYNPKVIQATMGALLSVNVYYFDLKRLFREAELVSVPVIGTVLGGNSIYDHKPGRKAVILLGNESKGISSELLPHVTERITIPRFGDPAAGIDSLNVGMAASIVFSEFMRKSGHVSF